MANVPLIPFVLSGAESMRLRAFCSAETWNASDLDAYGALLQTGRVDAISKDFENRVSSSNIDTARQDIAAIGYGPTKVPIYNYLLQLMFSNPGRRAQYIEIIRYLALSAKVPPDSMDLSGNTTFMWAISTKPYWEPEIANIMLEIGAKVNHRNRYGCTAAHDIVMVGDYSTDGKKKVEAALKYFVVKGGDLDIKCGDGISARTILKNVSKRMLVLKSYCKEEEGMPRCAKCNAKKCESGQDLLGCGRCKVTKYCSGECQKADWKKHKGDCGK